MSYAFPTNLSIDEIQQCLNDLQIYLDPSQLVKPTYEAIRTYYEQAVVALMSTSREELMQPDFSALAGLEYPELHDESIPTINFYQKLSKLMLLCGVKDFNLNDVYKPEPARLKRNFCAIINFAKFRDEKIAMLDEQESRVAEKSKLERALKEEQEKNLAELKRLKDLRAAREQEAAAIVVDLQAVNAKNMQLKKVHTMLSEEIRATKAQANALADQAAEAKLTLNSLDNEAKQLQDQIVQNPEKIKMAIDQTKAAVEKQREYYDELCSTYTAHERTLDMFSKTERMFQQSIKLLEELEARVAKKKAMSAATKDTRAAIANATSKLDEFVSMESALRRQLAVLVDKLSRQEQQAQVKLDLAAAYLEQQVKRREAAEAEHAAGDARAAEQEAKIRHWRERSDGVRESKDAKVKVIMDKYNALRRVIAEFNRRLEAGISTNPDIDGMKALGDDGAVGSALEMAAEELAALDISQGRDTASLLGNITWATGTQRMARG